MLAMRRNRVYITAMKMTLAILLIIAMIATAGVLLLGLTGLARGGEFNKKYANSFMRWRVLLQAFAVAIFAILLLVSQQS